VSIFDLIGRPLPIRGACPPEAIKSYREVDDQFEPKQGKVFDLTQIDNAQRRINQRWQESEDLNRWLSGFSEPRIMAGDFNLTVDSPIYRDSWSQYQNAFSLTEFGYGHTKRTKINIFDYTSRIDHILSTPQFLPTRCRVGRDLGSDHLPLIADFVMK
jgi:endonuclease/exonuclease/phosphatase (EEP) superfamily protein YafD